MSSTRISTVFFDLGDTLVRNGNWVPGASELLAALWSAHVRLGIISNTANLTRPEIIALLPVDFNLGRFQPELVLFSSEVGVAKPAPQIFELAVQRAATDARECLFCTEDLIDTLAAQQVGLIVARVQRPPGSDISTLLTAISTAGLV